MSYNKVIYFLTLCKTYPVGYNYNHKPNRYHINEKFIYNGFSLHLSLSIDITPVYVHQLKDIRINGKHSTMRQLQKVITSSYLAPPMSEIWY